MREESELAQDRALRRDPSLRIAVVGFGRMGRTRKNAVDATGIGEVVAVVLGPGDSNPEDIPSHDLDSVLSDPSIDAIFACSVNSVNSEVTKKALISGKHVFCEKPPAMNLEDMRAIRSLEEQAQKVLMYGFNHRHHGGVRKMREILDSGKLGQILWMRGRYGKSVDKDFLTSWRANPKLSGGGILMDQGIHMLDMMQYLAGDFDEVQAMVSNLFWDLEGIEDNVFLNMRNSRTGVAASLHSTMIQWRHIFSFEVFMEKGYMVLNGLKTSSNSYGAEELVVNSNSAGVPAADWRRELSQRWEEDESWEIEARLFSDLITSDDWKPGGGGSGDALKLMEIIDRVYSEPRFESSRLYGDLQLGPKDMEV